ncbi:MAG: AAA family ATPase [Patescibacteria group bacterium]|nr:AAA family ATPase [Patescibacteria group bacterium]
MFLERLELQGFKTFALKTTLEFLAPAGDKKGTTAIVGPNGSGKSNIADAVRWAMGEQSLKLLRGKKSEDVIFSGTPKRSRAGFAEVSLYLNNEDRAADIDYSELVITRRLYRDGVTEYYLNNNKARLQDIQLLLAQANFGQRSYAVIGQGMVDHILVATPQERKEFFDEAAGVKQYQIKRQSSVNKLEASRENLNQALLVMQEIEPRLRSLTRLAKRLERREETEAELGELQKKYYGTLWKDISEKIVIQERNYKVIDEELIDAKSRLETLQSEFSKMEREEPRGDVFSGLQNDYQQLMNEKSALREKQFDLQRKIELASLKEKKAPPVPVAMILSELEEIDALGEEAMRAIEAGGDAPEKIRTLAKKIKDLLAKLKQPDQAMALDPGMEKDLKEIAKGLIAIDNKISAVQQKITNFNKDEEAKRGRFFSIQRELQEKGVRVHDLESRLNDVKIEQARFETKRESLEQEMRQDLAERAEEMKSYVPTESVSPEAIYPEMARLKHQLDLIGAIDPETLAEYNETQERFTYLEGQTKDLSGAIDSLEQIIGELDQKIKAQSESAFRNLNREFEKYFKLLFGGGEARLIQVNEEITDEEPEEAEAPTSAERNVGEEAPEEMPFEEKPAAKKKIITGVEIQATPPGKRLKSINALSGGERALTSIALICAIMTNNPSPFIVLDEVDAALDESNSIKFSKIIDELSKKTQFIVISHNRATMDVARVLYGVTMGDDGVSKMLSVKLEEAAAKA